jgi:predicted nucleic acid-binding Zn ribbon protein
MMGLCGYRPGAWSEAQAERAKSLPRRLHATSSRPCAVCFKAFEPVGPRLYTCSHDCSVVLRRARKRKADAARMKRLRKEKRAS